MKIKDLKKENYITIGGDFLLFKDKLLGKGSYGNIYLGYCLKREIEVAIKEEKVSNKIKSKFLLNESAKLKYLQESLNSNTNIPKFYNYQETDSVNYMIMELLNFNIEELFNICGKSFTLKTLTSLGIQTLDILKNIHLKGVIHRDIKPDNFVIGKDANSHLVYIIDFGLGKFYKDLDNGKHINHRYGKGLIGTARYASINAFLGIELSRRDDLESLAYTLIYLAHGSLPWMYIPAKSKLEKHQKILKMKQNFSPKDLINEIPRQLIEFLNYTKSLFFDQEPNYDYLNSLIVNIMNERNLKLDYCYDWKIINTSTVNSTNSKEIISTNLSETIEINDLDFYQENFYKDFNEIFEIQNTNNQVNKIDNCDTNANANNKDSGENTEEYIPKNVIYLQNQLFITDI